MKVTLIRILILCISIIVIQTITAAPALFSDEGVYLTNVMSSLDWLEIIFSRGWYLVRDTVSTTPVGAITWFMTPVLLGAMGIVSKLTAYQNRQRLT